MSVSGESWSQAEASYFPTTDSIKSHERTLSLSVVRWANNKQNESGKGDRRSSSEFHFTHVVFCQSQLVIAAVLAVAAAAPSSPAYPAGYKTSYPDITITAQSDVRNLDGSGAWR